MTIHYSPAFTSPEAAETAHTHGKRLARVAIVKIDGEPAMAVVGAEYVLEIPRMRKAAGTTDILLAEESEFRGRLPEVETGAIPPFGNLYGMDVFVSKELTKNEDIVFNAGTHTELVRMSYADFERMVKPKPS